MDSRHVDVVFDVGANIGQFAKKLRISGYTGEIYSFEPLEAEHMLLTKSALGDKNWTVVNRCAVGSTSGHVDIRVSKNSYSSSILEINQRHIKADPTSQVVDIQQVQIITLDGFTKDVNLHQKKVWLKIDTQGFEYEVLLGAKETLPKVDYVQVEMSIEELYEGQKSFIEIIEYLEKFGFKLWNLEKGFCDHKTGQLMQFDGFFLRK
jgi:FkbM family methyltransferase